MSTMTVGGPTAGVLLENIGHQIEFTWRRSSACGTSAVATGEDDIRLWTFLANARFGEEEIQHNGLADRLEYHRRLVAWHPQACLLLRQQEPLKVKISADDQYAEFDLQAGIGYSSVIPLSELGYEVYTQGRVSAFAFDSSHVFQRDRDGTMARYILLEGLLYFPSLGTNCLNSPDVVLEGIEPGGHRLIMLLIEHIARYIPGLCLDGSSLLSRKPCGKLPILLCCDNGGMGEKLAKHAGFLDSNKRDKEGHPIFELDLADFNTLPPGEVRRTKMERPVKGLVKACTLLSP